MRSARSAVATGCSFFSVLGLRARIVAPAPSVEEAANQIGDLPRRLVQGEVAGLGHVLAVGRRAGDREGQVVLAPHHQGRGLMLAEIGLPLGYEATLVR